MYNLNINGNDCIEEQFDNSKLIVKDWKYNDKIYKIIRYDKNKIETY